MIADTVAGCPERVSVATLSAWSDGVLDTAQAEPLQRHLPDCTACQARLGDYAALADALRAIKTPEPAYGYGHNPRLRALATTGQAGHAARRTRLRFVGGLGAVAAVLLVALAFTQLFAALGHHAITRPVVRATATSSPDRTPFPFTGLSWQPGATLPDHLNALTGDVKVAIAPNDGSTAYGCDMSLPPQGSPSPGGETHRFWVTHDRGAHWAPALSITAQPDATFCTIAIDALDPSIVVLASSHADFTAPSSTVLKPNQTVSEVTFDGGVTWQRLAGNQLLLQPTTVNGVTFAMRHTQSGQLSSEPITTDLAMSSDQLHTWTPVDAAIRAAAPPQTLLTYWLNPTNGALLVETLDTRSGNPRLWSSADTGQHWRELPITVGGGAGVGAFAVQPPSGDAPWHICGATTIGSNASSVVCSADGGATWTQPIPMPGAPEFPGIGVLETRSNFVLVLATDGALLLTVASAIDAQQNRLTGEVLYRLPAGATSWLKLGPLPEPIVFYASGPGAGTLWALPGPPIVFDPQGRVFTASYP